MKKEPGTSLAPTAHAKTSSIPLWSSRFFSTCSTREEPSPHVENANAESSWGWGGGRGTVRTALLEIHSGFHSLLSSISSPHSVGTQCA